MNRSMITLAALLITAATVPAQGRFPGGPGRGGPGPGFGPWAESRTPVTGAPYSAVRTTVVHEVGHHFGIDDHRLHELGW